MIARVSLPVVLAFASSVSAFWRMPCRARTGLARIDPIVNPGVASEHPHAIHGAGDFGMNSTYDDLMNSDCTSCGVMEDKSAYWTPPMYFQYTNGTVEIVPQVGGMLAYYLLYGEKVTAFPEGFRLLAGDTRLRNFTGVVPDPPKSEWNNESQFTLGQRALGFNCLNYDKTPEGSLYRHFMPDKAYLDANCKDGIRAEIMFPSCWNGKDLDSTDHKSHMAYPSLTIDGTCPEGFDTRLPSLFFETIWDTNAFNGKEGFFLFGNGDPTGYGYHGDFLMGWDEKLLQTAVDTCKNNGPNGVDSGEISDCKVFTLQSDEDAAKCSFKMPTKLEVEDCAGPRDGICGAVPVQYGPAYASKLSGGKSDSAVPTSAVATSSASVPVLTYKPGSIAVTNSAADNAGGDITIANVKTATSNAAKATDDIMTLSMPAKQAQSTTLISSTKLVASVVGPSSSIKSITTPAPVAAQADSNKNIVSTTRYTSNGAVYEVAIEEVQVTVTQTTTAVHKRHAHQHHRRGGKRRSGYDF